MTNATSITFVHHAKRDSSLTELTDPMQFAPDAGSVVPAVVRLPAIRVCRDISQVSRLVLIAHRVLSTATRVLKQTAARNATMDFI